MMAAGQREHRAAAASGPWAQLSSGIRPGPGLGFKAQGREFRIYVGFIGLVLQIRISESTPGYKVM